MKILYVYRTARKEIFTNAKKHLEPDHLLYGANHLQKLGFQIEFSDIAYSPVNLLHLFLLPLERVLIKITSIGFKLDQAILLLPKALSADLVIATTDSAGLPLLLMKKLGILKTPLIYISTGLVNELQIRRKNLVFKIYQSILKVPELIVCHSEIEKRLLQKLVPEVENRVNFIPFGVDTDYFKCPKKTNQFILSVGRDRSRDYKFLAKVAEKMSDHKFVVVTSKSNILGIVFPKNVQLYFDLPYKEVKKFYFQSKVVFLPLKELQRASGQISFLEALASNNKVVISKVTGILDYKSAFYDNVYLFDPGDLEGAIRILRKSIRAKTTPFKMNEFTSENYANNLGKLIKSL